MFMAPERENNGTKAKVPRPGGYSINSMKRQQQAIETLEKENKSLERQKEMIDGEVRLLRAALVKVRHKTAP